MSNISITTAMCVWEWCLENEANHKKLKQVWPEVGTWEMRNTAVEVGKICDQKWDILGTRIQEAMGCFDWDFVPLVCECIDWKTGELKSEKFVNKIGKLL